MYIINSPVLFMGRKRHLLEREKYMFHKKIWKGYAICKLRKTNNT